MSALRVSIAKLAHGLFNLAVDLRFGAPLMGMKGSGVQGHAQVVNSDYALYPHLFAQVAIAPTDVVVDVGSGRGRFINWLLWHRLGGRIIGIEYDKATAEACARRLRRHARVTILHGDATVSIPQDGTVFFMFNPFETELMRAFRDRFVAVFGSRASPVIVYLRPLELAVFRETPGWQIEEFEIPEADLDARYEAKRSHRKFAILRLQRPSGPEARSTTE